MRYLILGGEAVIFHGHVRLTGDVDFFFSRDPANLERLFAALDAFWDGDVPGLTAPPTFRRTAPSFSSDSRRTASI